MEYKRKNVKVYKGQLLLSHRPRKPLIFIVPTRDASIHKQNTIYEKMSLIVVARKKTPTYRYGACRHATVEAEEAST